MTLAERMNDMEASVQRKSTPAERAGDAHPRPTGQEHFDSLTREEQDAALGPDVAEAVRKGEVQLSDLVQRERHPDGLGFITQASAKDLGITAQDATP